MIQRRQSIYLFLASLIAALLLILDLDFYTVMGTVANAGNAELNVGYFTTKFPGEPALNNSSLIGGLAGYAGICFVTIFMYKHRKNQVLACTLGFAMLIFSTVMMYRYSLGNDYFTKIEAEELLWPALIPLSLFIFQFMALRGIKQDEALVKSLDRIR